MFRNRGNSPGIVTLPAAPLWDIEDHMKKGESKAPSQRQLRVGEELRHALAWILERGEIRDPGLGGVAVTVT